MAEADPGIDTGLIDATFAIANPAVTRDTATPTTLKTAEKYAREQYLACTFLLGSDRRRYGKLLENLENEFTQKTDKWLKTITDAYSLACFSIGNKTLATSFKLSERVAMALHLPTSERERLCLPPQLAMKKRKFG